MVKHKLDFEQTKKHFEAFWNKDYYERCNLAIRIDNEKNVTSTFDREYTLEERYTDPQYLHNSFENYCENSSFLAESIPAQYINFGTAGHCEYFGSKPTYATSTIWFDPILNEPNEKLLVFSESGKSAFKKHIDIAMELSKLSNGKYFTAMPDNCGIVDCLAEIRGSSNLLIDMIENPEFVTNACNKITQVWKQTQTEFFDTLKENNLGGSSHGWMQTWCKDRHAQIQCDFSVMISPTHFEQFVLPELIETSEFLDHTSYHLDGVEQLRHLDMILSVKTIDNIQWTPVDGQPKTSASIESLQKIQKSGKGLILIPDIDEVEFLMSNLSHKGLHLVINGVKDLQQAQEIIALSKKLAH